MMNASFLDLSIRIPSVGVRGSASCLASPRVSWVGLASYVPAGGDAIRSEDSVRRGV